jgi:hypothetical protein
MHPVEYLRATFLDDPLYGAGYQSWSGVTSNLAYVSALGIAVHRFKCAEHRCFRLGHPGRSHRCRRHHRDSSQSVGVRFCALPAHVEPNPREE